MAPSRASRRTAQPHSPPPPQSPPLSLLVLAATLAALALATPVQAKSNTHARQPQPTGATHPPATTGTGARGVHVPLLRRNGHLRALARTPSQQDQHDIVAGWALREKDRLAIKYGVDASTTAADLKRRGDDSKAESPQNNDYDDENGEGTRRTRKGRRRVSGLQVGDAREEDDESVDDAWSIARRQLAGPNGGHLGTTVSSSTAPTTRTALSTAGYGTATAVAATRTSGGGSSSGSVNNSATRTAPTTFPGPTQTVPVGDVHLLNYDADL